ncbi:hypothetical protein IQ260_24265 [Leptolyngbya cf. ectocarpi LEGE 11479]|uniref:Uncharacterized protein n=1 Tax=Leptolyngbya cf. ectocarpi LEGE 11479 TaxID=1828722 RepID=A0A928ZYG3_LEPEC|nr:hypothetical protein [Leptolyngbya ectocarpi]MBE9069762.1 hypothetical protein [Leptolyngbya cf. ectocarpi LEGE 11479]
MFIRALPYVTAQLSTYGLRFMQRPVVWLALGSHGLLLLLPAIDLTASTSEELVNAESEDASVIEVQNLSDLIGAVPTETELPPPPEPEEAPPEEPTPAVPPEEVVITDSEDIPENPLPEEPPEDLPLDSPPPDNDPPQPPFDRSGAQRQASDRTRSLGETTPPAPLLLEDSQRPFFFDMNAGNKLEAPLAQGLTDLIVFNDATLVEKEQAILDSFTSGGDNPVPAGEYGGSSLYQLVNAATNEEVGYLSIFQGSGGQTVFVGIWDSRPQ